MKPRGKGTHHRDMAIQTTKTLCDDTEAIIHVGHLPTDNVFNFTTNFKCRSEWKSGREWRLRTTDRVGHYRQVNRTILSNDLIEPNFGIIVGIPTRCDVLRPTRRCDENAIDAKRLAVFSRLHCLFGRQCPGSGYHRDLTINLFHRDLEDAALFSACQIENLARLGIDAQTAAHSDEFFILEEMLQEFAVSRFIDLHLTIVGQQSRNVEMVSDGLHDDPRSFRPWPELGGYFFEHSAFCLNRKQGGHHSGECRDETKREKNVF